MQIGDGFVELICAGSLGWRGPSLLIAVKIMKVETGLRESKYESNRFLSWEKSQPVNHFQRYRSFPLVSIPAQ